MAFYRLDGGGFCHVNFGRKSGPAPCVGPAQAGDDLAKFGGRCGRMSVCLCDWPAGKDLAGKPVTCDAPVCERHRTRVGPNVDHCWRHGQQQLPTGGC